MPSTATARNASITFARLARAAARSSCTAQPSSAALSAARLNPATSHRAAHTTPALRQAVAAAASPLPPSPSAVVPPHERARLAAFTARTGLNLGPELLKVALTHRSYGKPGAEQSARFEFIGERALDLYVTEHIYLKYPELPTGALASVVKAYVGDKAMQKVAVQFGVPQVMRWKGTHTPNTRGEIAIGASVLRSLIGALHTSLGSEATRAFVRAHFLSRTIDDLSAHLKVSAPMATLALLMKSQDRIRPVSRLLQETGRLSHAPVFLVGIYSGVEKIGEGAGSSKSHAEHSAAVDALCKHYLREVEDFSAPSEVAN
ncbi:ribonuclease III domain-containing protein [Geranomyces variabilis]|nr:ribonuclease III domain-containing protein [Geranomyces variabilis]KAJ3140585.1 hypothetical protein HDU90_007885 [Geranomyces variabilis]